MRFQHLVFRTTPDSVLEWFDAELEKRGVDAVYTHCILSILQEDSDGEPDDYIDLKSSAQKIYRKYWGPESLYTTTKSWKRWKSHSKQLLLTANISCCSTGISNLERKKRDTAISCLKSVSDDTSLEDLIDELCLKLKKIRNITVPEKQSGRNLNIIDNKETAFYTSPSSPTDQVQKYFEDFPSLNRTEERIDSNQIAHINVWHSNCTRKNKNIFKNSNLNVFQNSEHKQDYLYGSLKSIENIYQSENNGKTINKYRLSYPCKHDEKNLQFTDENIYTNHSLKMTDENKNLSVSVKNYAENEDLNIKSCGKIGGAKILSGKSRCQAINKIHTNKVKESNARKRHTLNSKRSCNHNNVNNTNVSYLSSNKFAILMEEESTNLGIEPTKMAKHVTCKLSKLKNVVTSELNTDLCKKDDIISVGEATKSPLTYVLKPKQKKKHLHSNNACNKLMLHSLEMQVENKKDCFGIKHVKEMISCASYENVSARTELFTCLTSSKTAKSNSKALKLRRKKSHSGIAKMKTVKNKGNINISEMNFSLPQHFKEKNINLDILQLVKIEGKILDLSHQCIGSLLNESCVRSNATVFSEKDETLKLSHHSVSNKSFSMRGDNSDISLYFPLYHEKDFCKINSVPNINLVIIENNVYYKFNQHDSLKFVSPNEIFNIITVGDIADVVNLLRKFSVQCNFNFNIFPNFDTDVLPNQETKVLKFHNRDSKCSNNFPMMKFSSSFLQSIITSDEYCFSFPYSSFHTEDKKISSEKAISEEFCYETGLQEHSTSFLKEYDYKKQLSKTDSSSFEDQEQFESGVHTTHKKMEDCQNQVLKSTQVVVAEYRNKMPKAFGIWNYNVLFDINKHISNIQNLNDAQSISYESNRENMLCLLPSQLFGCDSNDSIYSSEHYNVTNVSVCSDVDDFSKKSIGASDPIGDGMDNLGENHFSSSCSHFKPVQKGESQVIANSKRCERNLLKKITSIDRIILKINAQKKVASFINASDNFGFKPWDVWRRATSRSPDSLLNSSFDSNKNDAANEVGTFMLYDSFRENESPYNRVHKCFKTNWSTYLTKSDENLRDIFGNNTHNLRYIWENSSYAYEKENIDVNSDNSEADLIQNDFKDHNEYLNDICTMPYLKDGLNIVPPAVTNFESSYSLLGTNSELVTIKEGSNICVPIISETISEISNIDAKYEISVHSPDDHPVDVFSEENCKKDVVDSEIAFSESSNINFPLVFENKSYQDYKFDLSAFRGPYGSYSENKTNYMVDEDLGLDSDTFIESGAFYDRSSSLHELSTTDLQTKNIHKHFNNQQFSYEDISQPKQAPISIPRRQKHALPISRRPCAFYMGGFCNRNDCKFSHDLSNITCRFWQEDSCFKGLTCPFLHGYVDNHNNYQDTSNAEYKKKYSLDSEDDFPSLSSTTSVKKSMAKSVPVDIVHVKGLKKN